jgi:hypothetical protein
MRSSHGMITHLRAGSPSGRTVEFADGTVAVGWEDEDQPGRRGFLVVTRTVGGRGRLRTWQEAATNVCDVLGLGKGYILGGQYSG